MICDLINSFTSLKLLRKQSVIHDWLFVMFELLAYVCFSFSLLRLIILFFFCLYTLKNAAVLSFQHQGSLLSNEQFHLVH